MSKNTMHIHIHKKTIVILAAGDGTRLGLNIPKCLIDINGKSIIERLYEIVEPYVDKVVLVIGYKAEEVKAKTSHLKKIIYVENPDYAITETYYSLWLTKKYTKDGFYLIDGDMVIDKAIFESIVECSDYSSCAVVDYSTKPDVGVVCTDQLICAIGKGVKHPNAESLNIFKFSSSDTRRIFTAKFIKKETSYYEEAFDMFRMVISPIKVNGKWYEIDTLEDLERARRLFK